MLKYILFLIVLVSLCAPSTARAVIIYNHLGGYPLTVHCRSKDDDLQTHVLNDSENFTFRFTANWPPTTLFYCELQWQLGSLTVDVYSSAHDSLRCLYSCRWEARQEAFLGYNDDGENDKTYPWK